MIYYKPKNLTYSDLCIFIDNNAYSEDCDEYVLYQYLYVLIDMLAKKNRYFKTSNDYEDFCVYATNKVFMRLKKPNQTEEKKIHYILPFLKASLPFIKIDYQKEVYSTGDKNVDCVGHLSSFEGLLYSMSNEFWVSEFKMCLNDIWRTLNEFFKKIPKKKNSSEWTNIKLSTLLTFLDRITLSRKEKDYINGLISTNRIKYSNLVKVFSRRNRPILIGLDSSYETYISALAEELRMIIGKDLSEILNQPVMNDYQDLIKLSLSTLSDDDE